MRANVIEQRARLAQHAGARIARQQLDGRIGFLHGPAEGGDPGLVSRAAALVADLPVLDAIRLWMAVARPQPTHRRVGGAIEVLDLQGGIFRLAAGKANADKRLGADLPAKLDDLLQSRSGRLQAAPGTEGLAAVGITQGVAPFKVAVTRFIQGAAAEANDSGFQSPDGGHDVGPPAAHGLFRHERCIVQPQSPRAAEGNLQSRVGVRAAGDKAHLKLLP